MSVINSSPSHGTDAVSQLVSKVLARFDTDKNGSLNAAEFSGFLGGLLSGTGGVGAMSSDPTPTVTRGAFRSSLAGFDFTKLDNPSIRDAMTSKYRAGRIFQDYPPQPESLPAVVARLRAEGINAMQTDFDKIDFGDGYGPIDVIQGAYPGGGVAWQWLPVGEL